MKNLLLLYSALLIGVCTSVQAQNLRLGFKTGLSFTSFVGPDAADASSKPGFQAGLLANLRFNDLLSVQPEVQYSTKGAKIGRGNTISGSQSLKYLDVPVLVRANYHQFFAEAGPQLGILLSAAATNDLIIPATTANNKSLFNPLDVGYAIGAGVQAASGPFAGVRYNGGIRNIAKSGTTNNQLPEGRNSALQFYVGFLFGGE